MERCSRPVRSLPGSLALAAALLAVAGCSDGATGETAPSSSATSTPVSADDGGTDASVTVGPETDPVETEPAAGDAEELFPDVVGVAAERDADGSWTFRVTLSSPYDSAERYADAWRVLGPDGEVYGVRELTHDHAAEQPFTRSQSGIAVPDGVTRVTVEGRDQVSGWGGGTMEFDLG